MSQEAQAQPADVVAAAIAAVEAANNPPTEAPQAETQPAQETKSAPPTETPQEESSSGQPKRIATEADFAALLRRDSEVSKKKRATAEPPKVPTLDDLRTKAQQDKAAVLKELGIDPAAFVVDYLAGPAPKNEQPNANDTNEVAELKKELAEMRERFNAEDSSRQRAAIEQQRTEAMNTAKSFLTSNAEKFEVLSKYGQGANVLLDALVAKYDEDRDYYESNGTAPTFSDVVEGVEEYAVSTCKKELQWISELKKMQPIILELADKIRKEQTRSKPKTLDNAITADTSGNEEPATEAERIALAIKRIQQLG